MTSGVDKYKLPGKYDRRRRTSDEERESMKRMYAVGISQRRIAEIFGVCQSTVLYIVSKKARDNLAAYRKANPQKRRTSEEMRDYMRDLRSYKRGVRVREREEGKEKDI